MILGVKLKTPNIFGIYWGKMEKRITCVILHKYIIFCQYKNLVLKNLDKIVDLKITFEYILNKC